MRKAVTEGDMLKWETEMKVVYTSVQGGKKHEKVEDTVTAETVEKCRVSEEDDTTAETLKARGVVPAGRPCELFKVL